VVQPAQLDKPDLLEPLEQQAQQVKRVSLVKLEQPV
jgi:hypothetical protein